MPVELYVGPAASGKTAWCLEVVRQAANGLQQTPRVVVPGSVQTDWWQRRLASLGSGVLGVRVGGFERLYREWLAPDGGGHAAIGDAVQYRLLRVLLDRTELATLGTLRTRPGFASALQVLLGELRSRREGGEDLADAVAAINGNGRLRDISTIHAAYLRYLAENEWEDDEGLGWRAVEAIRSAGRTHRIESSLVVADGFDALTPLQAACLAALSESGCRVVVALTTAPAQAANLLGDLPSRRIAEVEELLGTDARPLPAHAPGCRALESGMRPTGALARLRSGLFAVGGEPAADPQATVTLIEAPDRAGEVRAALRWLKAELIRRPDRPEELALLARRLDPYRDVIVQVAGEYGLPLEVAGGLPLAGNPAVAALLDLLRLMVPLPGGPGEPSLDRRLVLEAWRSPYLAWDGRSASDDPTAIGVTPARARELDTAARAGRVIRGLDQWTEALDLWVAREGRAPSFDEDRDPAASAPNAAGSAAAELRDVFRRFVRRMMPPSQATTLRQYVRWTEDLMGSDPQLPHGATELLPDDGASLSMVRRIREADTPGGQRDADIAALQRLKEVMRGLVWAEDALGTDRPVDYTRYVEELEGAVAATSYQLPARRGRGAIRVAEVDAAAGTGYRAVAILGMAEGEFPSPVRDDPLISSAERRALRDVRPELRLADPLESRELERFYRAVASAWEHLLLVRPRMSDTGASWAPSPFWEEAARRIQAVPQRLTADRAQHPNAACSWPELLDSLRSGAEVNRLATWLDSPGAGYAAGRNLLAAMGACREVIRERYRLGAGKYDGDLEAERAHLEARYAQGYEWGTSRLEAYRSCPLSFLMSSVLHLEPRAEPAEGLDASQRGNVFHQILEGVYSEGMRRIDGTTAASLLALAPEVACRVLDAAPLAEGFRETAWWQHTRAQIEEDVRRNISCMCEDSEEFHAIRTEVRFRGPTALIVTVGDLTFRVQGVIDRVDANRDGQVRIVDYKTAGKQPFTPQAVQQGKKLQLPLYAAAARDALHLGEPAEGYYWHIGSAESSSVRLSEFPGGPSAAIEIGEQAAAEAVRGAMAGRFAPQPPSDGCPEYCVAAAFCWHYRAGFKGQ